MQIRTGEGKSMILGAVATVLGLLGFRVRCVCYSDYLSSRDYGLFEEVFASFDLRDRIKYSKITTLSEDTTAAKGDIRGLTISLLGKDLPIAKAAENASMLLADDLNYLDQRLLNQSINEPVEEILCIDEVDVFFGSNFYGQTYNQVSQLREPEVAEILKAIWASYKQSGRKQRLAEIKSMAAYGRLLRKMPGFDFLLDNEISLMLDQVRRVDDEPYFLDGHDRIGYKVMDTVSFEVTYGYRTVFAYLKESDKGNLKDNTGTLNKMLSMPVSCGQFSYANIRPTRILGVSGTLEAMGDFEKDVLRKFGIDKFVYLPSVYGQSNFKFDKAGDGVCIESSKSDFFHKICSEISKVTKQKRAAIVFFRDAVRLKEFESSPFYRQLGRQKSKLTEDMGADEKEFVIKKAATSGQLTISTAVFGRGTDFFCKDQRVQDNGGVYIIQTFLSTERSEEIQIQGRTARQGKDGTYQLLLLETDLKEEFGLVLGGTGRADMYTSLSNARDNRHSLNCKTIQANLVDATARDMNTHRYFDALLAKNGSQAKALFREIYLSMKKRPMPSMIDIDIGFAVDMTGSMGPYSRAARATMTTLINGPTSILSKLAVKFPEIQFKLRVATLACRDIEDKGNQFHESLWRGGDHFTEKMLDAIKFIESATTNASGGYDLAEDHIGALHRCIGWAGPGDWTAAIKIVMVLTDAPAHGFVPPGSVVVDNFSVRHPQGLTPESVIDGLMSKDIDLFFCSFNPVATALTENRLSQLYLEHTDNMEQREITAISMVPKRQGPLCAVELAGGYGQHIIFVLDESGSMHHNWAGVVVAYRNYVTRRLQNQSQSDLISVVQFDHVARVTVEKELITRVPNDLGFSGRGTQFHPAAQQACMVARGSPGSHVPVVVFMSDGGSNDASLAASEFSSLNAEIRLRTGVDLELHVIAFGAGAKLSQLQLVANSSPKGRVYSSADTAELSNIFVDIASSQDVGSLLEAEIGRRIADAVTDKLSLEYIG
jgi:Mg-chelatase subunit ChlD